MSFWLFTCEYRGYLLPMSGSQGIGSSIIYNMTNYNEFGYSNVLCAICEREVIKIFSTATVNLNAK